MKNVSKLKKVVSQFVDTYMEADNYFPLHEDDAECIAEHFRDLLLEDYLQQSGDTATPIV